ncbi:uncharacterized protein EV422DRAFT_606360 [Fimicolochytrium jonesii]|uniref:uncharacterized protein n=1 Tax=Fimicolochytrium jonesii TaxID=1396493 RepID=UPI0022FE7A78|nr:uncharacterized protein EV422DRAFT_606360 [Fimicolochytrium jonesii]KAI8817161.1 hypothetical protein EV422DRAFT_606360 [Fimicolochytrium jonesii]
MKCDSPQIALKRKRIGGRNQFRGKRAWQNASALMTLPAVAQPSSLPPGTTLSSSTTISLANIWPAEKQAWPSGTGYGISEVITVGMAILSRALGTDAVLKKYRDLCFPELPLDTTVAGSLFTAADWPELRISSDGAKGSLMQTDIIRHCVFIEPNFYGPARDAQNVARHPLRQVGVSESVMSAVRDAGREFETALFGGELGIAHFDMQFLSEPFWA